VTPSLVFNDAARAIEFYKAVFGAKELMRFPGPGGKIMHAELEIGDSRLMLCDEFPERGVRSPQTIGGSPVSFYVYVKDADAIFNKAIAAGAKETQPLTDMFYGDRAGCVTDPFGHIWYISMHKEDVSAEELQRRAAAMMSGGAQAATAGS
jgi:PhnB protein